MFEFVESQSRSERTEIHLSGIVEVDNKHKLIQFRSMVTVYNIHQNILHKYVGCPLCDACHLLNFLKAKQKFAW